MRIASKPYRKHYGHDAGRGRRKHRVAIAERGAIVDARRRIGDWEGDTVMGKDGGALLTMVERKTLYRVILRLNGKRAERAAAGMKAHTAKVKTMTFDNGLEFAHHQDSVKGLGADIYFAHPYGSLERGTHENTTGFIWQYFPKGAHFNQVSHKQIAMVMDRRNNRPRKTRGCRSPNALFIGRRVDLLAA